VCGVSECELETSTRRRPRPTRAVEWYSLRNKRTCKPLLFATKIVYIHVQTQDI
jgi:hypothetical protein